MKDFQLIRTTLNYKEAQCPICSEVIGNEPYKITEKCKYPVHVECGKWYVHNQIMDNSPVRCPTYNCQEDFQEQFISITDEIYLNLKDVQKSVRYLMPFLGSYVWSNYQNGKRTFSDHVNSFIHFFGDSAHLTSIIASAIHIQQGHKLGALMAMIIGMTIRGMHIDKLPTQEIRFLELSEAESSSCNSSTEPLALEDRC